MEDAVPPGSVCSNLDVSQRSMQERFPQKAFGSNWMRVWFGLVWFGLGTANLAVFRRGSRLPTDWRAFSLTWQLVRWRRPPRPL